MQKCPKCGTILDDSKKQCYMCGTTLQDEDNRSFADTISMLGTEDNIDIAPQSFASDFSDNEKVQMFYSDDMNKLNSLQYDNRSALQKTLNPLFDENDNLASNEPEVLDFEEEKPKKGKKSTSSSKGKKKETKQTEEPKKEAEEFTFPQEFNIGEQTPPPKKDNKKTNSKKQESNTFFNQSEDAEKTTTINTKKNNDKYDKSSYKYVTVEDEERGNNFPKIKKSFIFNMIAVIFLAVVLVIAIKSYTKPKDTGNNLGGLRYKISDQFELVTNDSNNRYYKYGDTCSIRIFYGRTTEGDDFINSYLNSMKEEFEGQENTETVNEEIMLNDNKWKSLSIINFVQKGDEAQYEHFIKYKYVSIFHNGNFYHTTYVNTINNSECKKMYEEFTKSLKFE